MTNARSASPHRPGRTATRVLPLLGRLDQTDDGEWVATTLDDRELGSFRFRSEAGEALVVFAMFGT